MNFQTPADEIVMLKLSKGELAVHLIEVGERIPWAEHAGDVVLGPPQEGDEHLQWNVNRYMVLGAYLEGAEIKLSPSEYRAAVYLAECYDSEV